MKKLTRILCTALSSVACLAMAAEKIVSQETMKAIYEEVKTPYKVGMVLLPEKGEKIDNPCVFRHGDEWYMIFVVFDGKGYETHLAKSADLVRWKRLGKVFGRAEGACWDSAQADGWPALLDPRWNGPNTLNKFDGRYWMMYIGGHKKGYETDPLSTGVAWTDDPSAVKQWTRYPKNPVFSPSDADARAFERKTIYKHYTVEDPTRACGGRFVDFYNAKQKGVWRETIGMAVSDDMLNWRRVGDVPVISNGDPAKFAISGDPMIRRIGDVWVMFYFGCGWQRSGAFDTFACSYDLKHWTKWEGKLLIEPSEPYDATYAHKPWVIKHNGVVYHFYCAVGNKGRGVALAMSSKSPRGLTVERLESPCGVDVQSPRFGWKMAAEKGKKGVVQSAYRILVASSKEKLGADAGDVWDSGKVPGADTIDVAYGGKPLVSSRRYWWKVRTWDGAGAESAWSAPATWVTGIMPPDGWKAKWIGPAPETRPDADLAGARWITAKPNARGDVVFSLEFDFAGAKPGEYVELRHAASTRHEIDVNGKEFHRHSGQVDRWNHLRFRDMTQWLKPGRNTMTVKVKKGGRGTPQAFICALRFPDGRRIVTNGTLGNDLGALRDTPYGRALVTREEIASPAFEKKIAIAKPVASAFLHVTGVGFYEASLNGRKIGDKVLDPSPTAYDKHVLYSTYDLGGALKAGENTLKVLVGHGWYDVRSIAVWNFDVAPWRDFPRMIAQLEIVYADGSRETVVSDGSWRQVESPVGYDCIREGEVVGAHHPAQPDFAKREIRAAEVSAPKGALVAENCPGAKVVRTIAPKAIHAFPDGTYVVEFPENFAGWIRMDVRGQKKGDVLVVRYDERANKNFSPATVRRIDCHFRYTASQAVCATGAEFQTDRFVSSGAEVERYEPRFTYNGFQYVVLKGLRAAPRKEDIMGCVVHTDFPAIGSFACSDETFNTLMLMGDRAYRSNFADGYPTDCPHREKNGWTGDASIASELAQYCYENTAAYEKWLRDIMDTQLANGDICCIVPTSGWGYRWGNGPAWDSAMPVVAWNLWCYRGDRRILDVVYPALKRYVDFTSTKARGNLVRHGIGDWNHVNRRHVPSTELTSSCYYRQAAAILSRIAAIKGLADDAARYAKLADAIKTAINAKFYKGNGVYDNARQTAQAFPLAFGVVPESERAAVEAKLVESVEREGCHVDIGLLGSKHVFRALSRAGRTDLAFKMLTNPTKPSPVEWIQKGGTTLWEDWGDGASRNHIMFGDFMAWAYQYIGGIQLPETAGSCAAIPDVTATAFREVVIAPQFIDALAWAKASVNGPNGMIATAWRREGGKVTLDVTVPPNTTAIVRLPGEPDRRVGAGGHSFVVSRQSASR